MTSVKKEINKAISWICFYKLSELRRKTGCVLKNYHFIEKLRGRIRFVNKARAWVYLKENAKLSAAVKSNTTSQYVKTYYELLSWRRQNSLTGTLSWPKAISGWSCYVSVYMYFSAQSSNDKTQNGFQISAGLRQLMNVLWTLKFFLNSNNKIRRWCTSTRTWRLNRAWWSIVHRQLTMYGFFLHDCANVH